MRPLVHRLGAAAIVIAVGVLAVDGPFAQSTSQEPSKELPKGLFPPALPGQAPSKAPAQAPSERPAPMPDSTPTTAPTLPDGRLVVPPLARVTDTAGVLGPAGKDQLEAKLAAFEQSKGSQIAVIVVPSTQPEPISDFTNRVGDAWKIGRKGVGDGVLITVAVKDRRVWISVARA